MQLETLSQCLCSQELDTEIFLHGPPDFIGANNSSGWMPEKEFIIFIHIDHFIKYVKPSAEKPILLLDNHNSYVNIQMRRKKDNIIMLSFSSYRPHNLQPLEWMVCDHLKTT